MFTLFLAILPMTTAGNVRLRNKRKEATAQHLQEMLDLAVAEEIDRIFYQLQFSSDQARAFADAIQGEAVVLNPACAKLYREYGKHGACYLPGKGKGKRR